MADETSTPPPSPPVPPEPTKSPYELEPEGASLPHPPATPPSTAVPAPVTSPSPIPKARPAAIPAPYSPDPKARIDKPGLLEGFDEDADFTLDPEVDKALGKPTPADRRARESKAALADPGRWLVQPGFPQWRSASIIAAVLAIAATVLSGVQAPQAGIWVSLYTLYQMILHIGTGLLACLIAARLTERGFNQPELAAARMAVAVTVFYLLGTARFPIPGRIEEILLGAAGYLGAIFIFFRLPRYETLVIAAAHGSIWIFMQIGAEIAGQIHRVSTAAPGAAS